MLKRNGIVGVGVVMSAMLGILVLGLAVGIASPGGSMFESISEGLGLVDEQVGSTITVEDKQTLSDAAKYVHDRASNNGCSEGGAVDQQNKDGGYEGLEGTYLGLKPPCAGMSGTIATEKKNAVGYDTGNDMEGVFSRVNFKISDDVEDGKIILDTNQDSSWLENHIRGAAKGTFYERTIETCGQDAIDAGIAAGAAGGSAGALACGGGASLVLPGIGTVAAGAVCGTAGAIIGFGSTLVADSVAGARFVGTKDYYNVFFAADDVDDRALWSLKDASNYDFSNSLYCYSMSDEMMNADFSELDFKRSPLLAAYQDQGGEQKILLCPGDEGYIQVNKGKPQNDGEAGEGKTGWAYKYPYIQVTEAGECDAGLYGESLDIQINQDPKMVEDKLSITVKGLFEIDDQVRFDFIKNNELIHQETVDSEGSSATIELTPGNNGMNVGSYTVKPTILRCDNGCRGQSVDITTSFEIENYKYYADYVPEERGLMGSNEITVSINNENDYSSTEPMTVRGFDYTVDANIEFGTLEDGTSNQCEFIVRDKDAGVDDHAVVFFRGGDMIQKEGALPSSDGFEEHRKDDTHQLWDSPWSIYDNLVLNDREWKEHDTWISSGPRHTLLVDSNGGKSFKLHGDLLCAEREDIDPVSWILCDESNVPEGSEFGEDYTIETNGREYLCEPHEGEWSQTGENIPDVITGVVTTDITQEIIGNSDVLELSESSFVFKPGESTSDDSLVWERLPEGDKSVEITFKFEEIGYLRVEAQKRAGLESDYVNYLYAGLNTHTEVGFDEGGFETGSGIEDTGIDYSEDQDYTFKIERSGTETTWEIRTEGQSEWSNTQQTEDFRRLVLKWLEGYSSGDQTAIVNVKNVEIEDK